LLDDLLITSEIVIPSSLLSWKAVRASGPGGQHVNKVSSKVELEFDLAKCENLLDRTKDRLRALAGSKLTMDDRILISCQESRQQYKNLCLALEKLAELIRLALNPPKPRRPTKPSRAAKERRLRKKRQRGEKKSRRSRPGNQEE